jgi:hypothetical protein
MAIALPRSENDFFYLFGNLKKSTEIIHGLCRIYRLKYRMFYKPRKVALCVTEFISVKICLLSSAIIISGM